MSEKRIKRLRILGYMLLVTLTVKFPCNILLEKLLLSDYFPFVTAIFTAIFLTVISNLESKKCPKISTYVTCSSISFIMAILINRYGGIYKIYFIYTISVLIPAFFQLSLAGSISYNNIVIRFFITLCTSLCKTCLQTINDYYLDATQRSGYKKHGYIFMMADSIGGNTNTNTNVHTSNTNNNTNANNSGRDPRMEISNLLNPIDFSEQECRTIRRIGAWGLNETQPIIRSAQVCSMPHKMYTAGDFGITLSSIEGQSIVSVCRLLVTQPKSEWQTRFYALRGPAQRILDASNDPQAFRNVSLAGNAPRRPRAVSDKLFLYMSCFREHSRSR